MIIINSNELIIVLYGFAFATPLLEMFYFAIFPGAKRCQTLPLGGGLSCVLALTVVALLMRPFTVGLTPCL